MKRVGQYFSSSKANAARRVQLPPRDAVAKWGASTRADLARHLRPLRQNLWLPTGRQLLGAAVLAPLAGCAGYYAFAYALRESLCYDRLQRVDDALYDTAAAAETAQRAPPPPLSQPPAERARALSAGDVRGLHGALSSPPAGVTVLLGADEAHAARWASAVLSARPACVTVKFPAAAAAAAAAGAEDAHAWELLRALADGLGLQYLKLRFALAAALPAAARRRRRGGAEAASDSALDLRVALDTVTGALEEIRGEGSQRQLHPVIVVRGLGGLLRGGGGGGGRGAWAGATWGTREWQGAARGRGRLVTGERHLAHVVVAMSQANLPDGAVDAVLGAQGGTQGGAEGAVWGPSAVPLETLWRHVERSLKVSFPKADPAALDQAAALVVETLCGPVGDAAGDVERALRAADARAAAATGHGKRWLRQRAYCGRKSCALQELQHHSATLLLLLRAADARAAAATGHGKSDSAAPIPMAQLAADSAALSPVTTAQLAVRAAAAAVWSSVAAALTPLMTPAAARAAAGGQGDSSPQALAAVFQLIEALGRNGTSPAPVSPPVSLPLPTVIDEYFNGDAAAVTRLLRAGVLRIMPAHVEGPAGAARPLPLPYAHVGVASPLVAGVFAVLARTRCSGAAPARSGEEDAPWLSIGAALRRLGETATAEAALDARHAAALADARRVGDVRQSLGGAHVERITELHRLRNANGIERVTELHRLRNANGIEDTHTVGSAEDTLRAEEQAIGARLAALRSAREALAAQRAEAAAQQGDMPSRAEAAAVPSVVKSLRHVLSTVMSAGTSSTDAAALHGLAVDVLEEVAEETGGVLAADLVQGVLSVLGTPLPAADIRRGMHGLAAAPGAQQVDVGQLVRVLIAQDSPTLGMTYSEGSRVPADTDSVEVRKRGGERGAAANIAVTTPETANDSDVRWWDAAP
ncbi:hypothetical protein JKP88DRAFT_347787 [Tribonema minus]|uniref:Uncharacterized protein n=1 Tax=Tribonema minus TaxID=303371 RepID=A0A835Z6A2_9STRA|nr:hypothetical protein JKP88DRAFT_347787 [Tribonema minus]